MKTQTTSIPALLERDRELGLLADAAARASDGAGGVVLVEGPAGVGKSRLLGRARALGREAGLTALEARGGLLERGFPFGVARQLFEPAVIALAPEEREVVFAGAARLAGGLVGHGEPALVPQEGDAAFGALHGLYWLTVNLADRGPLLLAVDDAHWGDPASLRFLAYLARRIEGLPVLLVAAGRYPDPEGAELWQALAEDPAAEVLRPGALSKAASANVVRRRLGADADDELCRACHRATGGNPLFLHELIGALAAAEIEPTRDAVAAVAEVGPPAVRRFVLHRLDRLGTPATELARTVAVLGGDVDAGLAARAAGLDAEAARTAADRLVAAEVLAADQRLRFVHPLVQAVVYEDMLPGDRAARHLAAAELLADDGAPPERIAAHLLESAPARAPGTVDMLRAAASSAVARGAPGAAAAYLRRALEEPPPAGQRAEILCDLGRWEIACRRYEEAHRCLREALAAPAEGRTHADAAIWLSRTAVTSGRHDLAVAADEALSAQIAAADGDLALELESEQIALTRVELPLRRRLPERLDRFSRRAAGHPRFEPVARIHVACERMVRAEPAVDVGRAIEQALAGGPPADPLALGMAIYALIACERYEAAARWIDLALGAARAFGLAPQLAALHTARAMLALARGAVGDAELDVQSGLELAGEHHFMLPRIVALAIRVAIERGELDAASRLAEDRADGLERERVFADDYLAARGKLRIARGDVRAGLTDLLRCGELLAAYGNALPSDWRANAARALAELGDGERAEALAREAIAAARGFGAAGALAQALHVGGRVIGGDEALALLEEAVDVAERSPARLEAAHALAALGLEQIRRRRRREGRESLRRALELARECGATALAERVRGDLGAGGGRPPRLETTGLAALTPAERRVCDLAAGELTNRQIAQTLFVTEKTVELHLTNAYRKLGIRSRFQLASVMAG